MSFVLGLKWFTTLFEAKNLAKVLGIKNYILKTILLIIQRCLLKTELLL